MRAGLLCLLAACSFAHADPVPARAYQDLRWRCIGPFRGGRTVGMDAVWSKPNVWYIGVNNGGVWKSTDFGHTWNSVFDGQATGSIGCLAIAQSQPDTVYVGSGEGLQRPDLSVGDGVYKTTDGGKTWINTGLKDGQQIGGICVDPHDPNRAFVAVLGHPYGPNEERGVFRTLDGGKTWKKVLYKDPNTGAVAIAFDPTNPRTLYADLWAARQAPWENGNWEGRTGGLFKSTDGGDTWKELHGGLPEHPGRIGFTVCAKDSNRIYATVSAGEQSGIYRSDDAGEHWRFMNKEPRVIGRGDDFAEVRVDPTNPDILYAANTSTYKSTDGGNSFVCIKGSPGGDDYHTIWINPLNPEIIGLAADQGACISVNGGETWSSWYNQPTAQLYHVSTDNAFPYNVYGGQQESGSVGIASRGIDGHITFRDWRPVGAFEYDYIAPDPLDPNIVYGSVGSRFDKRTGKTVRIRPSIEGLRYLRTMPMLFSPADPHMLLYASNKLLKSTDRGDHWDIISPDLSRDKWDVPEGFASVSQQGKTMRQRGVIYAVAPSPLDKDVIWCGTDDGLVWVTRDGGKNWSNVTPPGMTSWSKVSQIDAGHSDKRVAFVSVNRLRCDDLKPYIYRTSDFGKTWTLVVNGLPEDAPVNAVREDPKDPRLLYAATERQVWFSRDWGQNWNSLRMNMPATSVRDLVVKDDDLVIGTHGRSFWILDSLTPLRKDGAELMVPQEAFEVEWNLNSDTPLPPEEPAGENPPDGVPIDYRPPSGTKRVQLDILDDKGAVVRSWSSDKPQKPVDPKLLTVDPRWARPPQNLSPEAGHHRFVWDLRSAGQGQRLGMAAIWRNTPPSPGEFVKPGDYKVRLTVDGQVFEQNLQVKPDPRG